MHDFEISTLADEPCTATAFLHSTAMTTKDHKTREPDATLRDFLFAPVLSPEALLADPTIIPQQPGIYGWFFKAPPASVPHEGALTGQGGVLLYLGIAPNGPVSKRTLRDRLRDHLKGPIGSSTLRRTLTGLMAGELGLEVFRNGNGRAQLSRDHEARLTEWMLENATVAWLVCDEPWNEEKRLLSQGYVLPLNIQGTQGQFKNELRRLRSVGKPCF